MLLAVHISDGILATPWWLGGFALAGALAVFGARRIRDEEIPRIGLLTAALFVASSLHIRVGPTSVHLLLNGLAGVLLGRRVALAIPVAVALQALLLAHGGFTTIGVNSCIMTLPALLCGLLFSLVVKQVPAARSGWLLSLVGGGLGALAVAASIGLNFCVLMVAAEPEMQNEIFWAALIVLVSHLPVALIEGIVLAFAVDFLARVKPEMLGLAKCGPEPEASRSTAEVSFHPAAPAVMGPFRETPRPATPPTVPARD